jgi:signal transduction histidine kinase
VSTKLIALIAVTISLIVGVLTAYLSSRQVAEIDRQAEEQASVYGSLAARQLESAIAFGDRETAREVLDSLAKDNDLAGATVYASDGTILYHIGTPTVGEQMSATTQRLIPTDDGVEVIAPIVSKEGPRGVVVIELDSKSSEREQHDAILRSIVFCIAMLGVGVIAAWLITRTIAHRVHGLADVAEVIAEGCLDITPAFDGSSDEVGRLARAFDTMVVRLRASINDIRSLGEQKRLAIEQANLELERRIDQRTRELRRANIKLEREMHERAAMEIELRHAQKLESVGRLAAGVAHEINTPIQFVTDACTFIDGAATSFIDVITRAQGAFERLAAGTTSLETERDGFASDLDTADFAYLAEQVPPAVVRALEGLTRMATIVQSMKEFSHPDQTEKTQGDINRGLLATLEIARNEYKYVADVTTDLGELPQVMCHIGELNQAFLNIIVNAAHAIADVIAEGERGTIAVRTWVEGDDVKISISDTGAGIPDAIRDQIFDPFFTTKEVGKGSGQGLAIARSVIVDKHDGRIEVDTAVGRGTTFTLTVPYRDAARSAA